MVHLLHLDSSARTTDSMTRALSSEVIDQWLAADPESTVTYRDVHVEVVPYVTETWLGAVYSAPDQHGPTHRFALSRSDTLISEVEAADVVVIGAPMYNFAIPAALKAWVDQIARAGRTFQFGPHGPVGLLRGKRAVVLTSSGSDPADLTAGGLDFVEPYLRALLGFIGITDVAFVKVWGRSPDEIDANMATARAAIAQLVPLPSAVRSAGSRERAVS
ncbi:MAG: FMN-dependent NADH-azoreductase [Actinomycetota bacterium]